MSYVDSRPATVTVTVNVAAAEDAAATDGSAGGSAHEAHHEGSLSSPSSLLPRFRTSDAGARGRVGSGFITPPVQPGIWSGRVAFVSSSSSRSSFRLSFRSFASDGGTFISQHCPRTPAAAHVASSSSSSSPSSPQCAHALQPRVLEHSRQHPDADSAKISDPSRSIAPAGNVPTAAAQKPSSGSLNVRFGTDAFSSLRVGDASSAAGVAVAVAAADHASSPSFPSSSSSSFSPFPSSASSRIARTATLNAYVAPGVSPSTTAVLVSDASATSVVAGAHGAIGGA